MRRIFFRLAAFVITLNFSAIRAQEIEYVGSALWHQVNGVQVRGDYAYCAFRYGLMILNIVDPANPTFVGKCYVAGEGKELALAGDYAYMAEGIAGLKIIDISNTSYPILIGGIDSVGYVEDVAVLGNFVYLAGGESFYDDDNVIIADVSDPHEPFVVGHCFVSSEATGISVQDEYAYVTSDEGLSVINVANPDHPFRVGRLSFMPDFPLGLFISDSLVYVTSQLTNLRIVNVASPSYPRLLGSLDLYDASWDAYVSGHYAYLASHYEGMTVVDVADPRSPDSVGAVDTGDLCWGIFLSGGYAYLADRNNGFISTTINPTHPQILGTYAPEWAPMEVEVLNDFVYIDDDYGHLWIVDVSEPSNPVEAACYDPEDNFRDFEINGSCLYAACGYYGLTIYDISNPVNPVEICHLNNETYGVSVESTYAFVSDYQYRGLRAYDVSDPQNPEALGSVYLGDEPGKSRVHNQYIYVITSSEIKIVDARDPRHLSLKGSYDTQTWPDDIEVFDHYLIFGSSYEYLEVLDISDPGHLRVIDRFDIYSSVEDILVWGNYGFLCRDQHSLEVVDLSDPSDIRLVGYYGAGSSAICADNDFLYLAEPYGFQVLSLSRPDAVDETVTPDPFDLSVRNYPNPFNASTTISYSLSRPADLTIDVYDITGRKIKTLFAGLQAAGNHHIAWSPAGQSSGIYFYTLHTADFSRAGKCVLIR